MRRILVVVLSVATAALGVAMFQSGTAAPAGEGLSYKLYAIQVACDNCIATSTNTPTVTLTPTSTGTASATGTPTATRTATPTVTGTLTTTPTATSTLSPTATATVTMTATSTATATATTPANACSAATGTITDVDKEGEIVTIEASGNLTGWYLISVAGNQRFDFPAGFIAGGEVRIHSNTAQFSASATDLWWSASPLWNNSQDDDAVLYNCLGALVDQYDS